MKSLIFYYSWLGKTKSVAEALGRLSGSEIRRVEEVEIRRGISGFLMATFQALNGFQSELRPYNSDLTGYDRVFIGSPVWCGNPAPAVTAFLRETELKGKKIIIFCTHVTSKSLPALQKMANIIKERGGQIQGSFSIRSTRKNLSNLQEVVRIAAEKYL